MVIRLKQKHIKAFRSQILRLLHKIRRKKHSQTDIDNLNALQELVSIYKLK